MHQFTFPQTALVTVKADATQQRTRDLLDPSATISLITSRLANLLKVKRIRRSTDITGLTGMCSSDYQVEVDLGLKGWQLADPDLGLSESIVSSSV